MKKLERKYQRELLENIASAFPESADIQALTKHLDTAAEERYVANMLYLEAHGLVEANIRQAMGGDYSVAPPKITAAGLDFLADDGGLTAILGTVTIKFHEETLRALIASKIEQAEIDPNEKSKLLTDLRALPAESIKHLTMRLLDRGMENIPAALSLIQTALQGVL